VKPSHSFDYAVKNLVSLLFLFACPLLLTGQSNKKTNNPPPPPQKNTPAPQTQQQRQQTQQHSGTQPSGQIHPPGRTSANNKVGGSAAKSAGPNGTASGAPGGAASNAKPPATFNPPAGGKVVTTQTGHTLAQDKNGKVTAVFTKSGTEAHFAPTGKISTIRTSSGTTITQGATTARKIESVRQTPSGTSYRVVTTSAHGGYAERSFSRDGREYVRRTSVYENRTYVTVYRSYYYGGVRYHYYVPAYYYAPVYYGWVYNPWPAPIYYTWGWGPWYGPYGYYFAPYPVYPSAAFWLTDYLIAENLRAAYEAQAPANATTSTEAGQPAAHNGTVTLSPEVKQMIAEEVKAQLAAEQAAAQTSASPTSVPHQPASEEPPPALDPKVKMFIVTTRLDVTSTGQTCTLNPGDVLLRTETTPAEDNTVAVNVVSSQKNSCGVDSSPRVQVVDLQEMHNHFREQLDSGLKTLADNQGKNGIPTGPAAGSRSNREGSAAPDLSVKADLQKQQEEADQAEKEVQQASSSPTGRS